MTTLSNEDENRNSVDHQGNGILHETQDFKDGGRQHMNGGSNHDAAYEDGAPKTGFEYRMEGRDGMGSFHIREEEQLGNDGHNLGLEIGYLPPDQRPGLPAELLAQLADPQIGEGTEAGEALKANAQIKVPIVGKVARSINAQSVRKLAKRVTGRSKSGIIRGKPPRIPPFRTAVEDPDDGMYEIKEGEEEQSDYDADRGSETRSCGSLTLHDAIKPFSDPKLSPSDRPKGQNAKLPVTFDEPIPSGHSNDAEVESKSKKNKDKFHVAAEEAKDIPAEVVAATMEAGKKFLGAVDPHNMLQRQRWRRKKKGGKKSRKSYVKGKVIDGKHELYTLSIAVMLGVRTSIAKTNTIITSSANNRRMLVPQDFMAEEKYEFSPKGSPNTPPHKLSHTFKFKDYAPMAFAYIRRLFGVNEFDFLLSVCGNANFIEFISNAKSGQFFFYSSDGKYMIKTMTNDESKFLRRILPHYFQHCTQNPNTLMTKFYGMYRVKLYHLRRNVKFVIMNSVYYTDKYLQSFYDLKGSELGRDAKPGQDVLKDNDLRRKLPGEPLSLAPELRSRIRDQMVSDCDFLRKMKIMDYSMLIGVHHIPWKKGVATRGLAKTGFRIKERSNSFRAPHHQRSFSHDSSMMNARHQRSYSHDTGMMSNLASLRFDNPDDYSTCASSEEAGSRSEKARHSFSTETIEDRTKPDSRSHLNKDDSTRRLINDIRENNASLANFELGGLLEEDDDCSYLEGADERLGHTEMQKGLRVNPRNDDIELKKEQTIEQMYWPFHRFYDINGLRRVKPKPCYRCSSHPCKCEGHCRLTKAWNIPDFVPPLSNRKDGGFLMDMTGFDIPLTYSGPTGDRQYEGKIFYLGIIDILQQYNVRKRVETNYRKLEGFQDPSCVHPDRYAERFIHFFDEYAALRVVPDEKD